MDVIVFFIFVFVLVQPLIWGGMFLCGGLNVLIDFDPNYDSKNKKHRAILDVILGSALLLFDNLFFWLILWPFVVMEFKLNLPTFSL